MNWQIFFRITWLELEVWIIMKWPGIRIEQSFKLKMVNWSWKNWRCKLDWMILIAVIWVSWLAVMIPRIEFRPFRANADCWQCNSYENAVSFSTSATEPYFSTNGCCSIITRMIKCSCSTLDASKCTRGAERTQARGWNVFIRDKHHFRYYSSS